MAAAKGVTVADLIDTTEMYLRTILELEEEGVTPLRARISERLGHSGPTVSQTVGRMERDGLVTVSGDRKLELTEEGRHKAITVMRKHRLAERLLSDVIGLEWEYVHEEACRWEHVMSEQVERKLLKILGTPTESPYGNPIPGLEDLGVDLSAYPAQAQTVPVTALFQSGVSTVDATISRLAEPAQVDPTLLAQFGEFGIIPGNHAVFSEGSEYIKVSVDGVEGSLELRPEIAAFIFVEQN